jgi:hypothetical protein
MPISDVGWHADCLPPIGWALRVRAQLIDPDFQSQGRRFDPCPAHTYRLCLFGFEARAGSSGR